jgi:hypothetical protein
MGVIKLIRRVLSSRTERNKCSACIAKAEVLQQEYRDTRVRIEKMTNDLLATMNGEEKWFLVKENKDGLSTHND